MLHNAHEGGGMMDFSRGASEDVNPVVVEGHLFYLQLQRDLFSTLGQF